ncbi:transcriptional regulator [Streptococcus suis]|uniref:helix-turn-helix transcriptional regulator n=1 Tax=Streptococcus suis TaxID=1307 RepID=UPI00300FDF79
MKGGTKILKYRRVKGYRHMLNLSQNEMAVKLNISKQSYHNKEIGKTEFSDSEKQIIKELLKSEFPKITIDDIFLTKSIKKYYLEKEVTMESF